MLLHVGIDGIVGICEAQDALGADDALAHVLGDALALAGDYPNTRAAYERALQVWALDEKASPEIACSLQRKIGMTQEAQGDYDQALVCLGTARTLLHLGWPRCFGVVC